LTCSLLASRVRTERGKAAWLLPESYQGKQPRIDRDDPQPDAPALAPWRGRPRLKAPAKSDVSSNQMELSLGDA
jgi:hypothetical protein